MATEPIIDFGKQHQHLFRGPFLEIGSKIQPGYVQHQPKEIHASMPGHEWVGVDIEPGEGVDVVVDLCDDHAVDELGWTERFETVHCHCVLEHVPEVFALTRNIQRVLKTGGMLFVSVPFAWRIHRIPVDMWRFTPQSIDYLFPQIRFDANVCGISTRHRGHVFRVDQAPELDLGSNLSNMGLLPSLMIRVIRKMGLDMGFFSERALLMESNLMMIGQKTPGTIYT